MKEWALAHPWMTFFIVIFALMVLDSIQVNVANYFFRRRSAQTGNGNVLKTEKNDGT